MRSRPTAQSSLGRALLLARGLMWLGRERVCPCCGWHSRSFVAGGGSVRKRIDGYCPRCNAKARHRRVWLHLDRKPETLRHAARVLVVAPHESTLRALSRRTAGYRVAIDIIDRHGIDVVATAEALPFADATFDLVITIHVFEHLDDDRLAMREMARVLSPAGQAIVSVPCEWSAPTIEDPTVTSAEARRSLFGEADHRRRYGNDLVARLADEGLQTEVLLAAALDDLTVDRYGLSRSEHLFICRRAAQ